MNLTKIKQALAEATPGPWYDNRGVKAIQVTCLSPAFIRGHFNIVRYPIRTRDSLVSHSEWEANAYLIANAPIWLAELVARVEAEDELALSVEKAIEKNRAEMLEWTTGHDAPDRPETVRIKKALAAYQANRDKK